MGDMPKSLRRYKEIITLIFHTEKPYGSLGLTQMIRRALPDEHITVVGHDWVDVERIVKERIKRVFVERD